MFVKHITRPDCRFRGKRLGKEKLLNNKHKPQLAAFAAKSAQHKKKGENLMGVRYDPEKIAELRAARDALTPQMADKKNRLIELNEVEVTAATVLEKKSLATDFDVLSAEMRNIDYEISALEGARPLTGYEKRNLVPALSRWMARGANGLESGEAERYIGENDEGRTAFVCRIGDRERMAPQSPTRSDTTGDDGTTGAATPTEVSASVVERIAHQGSLEPFADTFVTSTGNDWRQPAQDDTDQKGNFHRPGDGRRRCAYARSYSGHFQGVGPGPRE